MAVLRMQFSKSIFILFVIGFIANDVNGACYRPNFTDPYAIILNPDKELYVDAFEQLLLSCEVGHTTFGFPPVIYCYDDGNWDTDVSDGRCYAQCNTTKLISDDDVKVTDDSGVQQTVFDDGDKANFACTNKSQLSGAEQGSCKNGTFELDNEPSCLVYCPVNIEQLGLGLYHDTSFSPVINETNTLYYRDGDVITYRCSDGYEGPKNRTPTDDGTSTCNDGSWDPPGIPTCMDIDDCANHVCQNGATCKDDIASYECQCPDGFNGMYCENVMTTTEMMTVTTMELPTSMETTTIVDQSTIATTTTEASTTEGLPTSLPDSTPHLTTPMTSTDSSTTSVVSPGLTTVTPDATSITPGLTTVTPDATSITPGLETVTPDATSITPGLTTVTPDATTITPDLTTVGSGLTTVTPDATTVTPAISTETATPTGPESTSKSDSTSPLTSTALLPETTKTESVRSTSPADPTEPSPTESQETTASRKTSPSTPERTEKPPTTQLPCGGECKATQVCNGENNCECRQDYYKDEDDQENPCKEPESIDVTIKITEVNNTNAEYKVELKDPSSPEFQKLEIEVCEPFEEIYKNDMEYKGCRVLEFSNGSIIVNYVLTFAENSNQSASTVNTTVQQELQNPNGSFTGDYVFDDSSLAVAPLDECIKKIDDCDPENANCIDQGADGYTCECREGFDDVGGSNSLPGRKCTESVATEPQPTEALPTVSRTTKEPEETGLEPWKVVVGVTVPIISILTITIVGLTCWQYRRLLRRTSPTSEKTKMTFPYDDDTRGSSDREASRPGSMMIMNSDGTVQEVVLPWRNIPDEEEFIFAPDNGKGRTQMLPMVDYPSDYAGSASYDNDPLGNIVGSYDNYTYQHQDMTNSTEIDSKYF